MSKKNILGLKLGPNSIGWALLGSDGNKPNAIIDLGSRIFIKAVNDKTPTPKNVKRRDARLARRVNQRRARRKQRMLNYLVKLDLLPKELQGHLQPEALLNNLGDPYQLRAKGLDHPLLPHEMGRVLLHLVQRRGFLSTRKTLLGDMADDPDVQDVLAEMEQEDGGSSESAKEETAFKQDISELRSAIQAAGCRTLGEYLASFDHHNCQRNRVREGGHLRTDRQMYREELDLIWQEQRSHHPVLNDDVKDQIEEIIFYQRPLKLRADRIGKCSLEPRRNRARVARLECQRARYLQDINNLRYFDPNQEKYCTLNKDERNKLVALFESKANVTFPQIRKTLGMDKGFEFNLEMATKKLKGNITASDIRAVYPEWDSLNAEKQLAFVEDLLTIKKKSVLKKRLITHWDIDKRTAVNLCMLEFEPGHSSHCAKAIKLLLPFLEQGQRYDEARISAGYGYETKAIEVVDRLGLPPEITNPIVQKALHEVRRVINAIIAEYGKPDAIRIEMGRDLEMNTKNYTSFIKQQNANTKANTEAADKFREVGKNTPQLNLKKYPGKTDKLKYRLWEDQDHRCVYSNKPISLAQLFGSDIFIGHILPYSETLDDSYMNKVVCFAGEAQFKGNRTPLDAFGGNKGKWDQITQSIGHWHRSLKSKRDRFYMSASDVQEADFIGSQLNDARYICKEARGYLAQLGASITTCKGAITGWVKHQWGLNDLITVDDPGKTTDYRQYAIDAVAIACVDQSFFKTLVGIAKDLERAQSDVDISDIHFDSPWDGLRNDLLVKLEETVVSHTPQTKINGELHTAIASGFSDELGTIYRQDLNGNMTAKKVDSIIDETVRGIVKAHLEKYKGDAKKAFAQGVNVYHKDGVTPIKRVRVVRSNQIKSVTKLESEQFGTKNQSGTVFKWQPYGNIHHVEVLRHSENGKITGQLITMMEAHKRAMTGTKSATNRGIQREDVVNQQSEGDKDYVLALHKRSTVSLAVGGARRYYVVKALGSMAQNPQPRITLIPHNISDSKDDLISDSISNLIQKHELKLHSINCIGKLID